MQGLTKRQEKVLDYITTSINERGYPPTLREIGSHMGISSTNGVNDHLRALERKGYLKREDMKSRALRPVHMSETKGADTVKVPIITKVVAGQPLLSEQTIQDTVTIDRILLGNAKEYFAMWVNGDAMSGAGIGDGDFIVVKKQMFAEKGDVVVALIGDNAAVRYYQPEEHHIQFVPANENSVPIMVKRSDFQPMQLLGVVTGVFKRL